MIGGPDLTNIEIDKANIKTHLRNIHLVWNEIKLTGLKSTEAQKVAKDIQEKFEGFKSWANAQIETL